MRVSVTVITFFISITVCATTATTQKPNSDPEAVGQRLMAATNKGNIVAVKEIVKAGADVNYQHYKTGLTPTVLAAGKGNLELVKFYLKSGADIDSKDKRGTKALHVAIVTKNKRST